MSVDQTSQLIQLLLNSLLMMALCGGVAIGLILRQTAIVSQIRLLKPLYSDALNGVKLLAPERFLQLKSQLRLLRHQYRLLGFACWSANSALILSAASTLLLALRTLVFFDRLIPLSLLLFTASSAMLLFSLVMGLLSLVKINAFGEERDEPKAEFGHDLKSGRSRSAPVPRDESGRFALRPRVQSSLNASLSGLRQVLPPGRSQFQASLKLPPDQQKPPRQ